MKYKFKQVYCPQPPEVKNDLLTIHYNDSRFSLLKENRVRELKDDEILREGDIVYMCAESKYFYVTKDKYINLSIVNGFIHDLINKTGKYCKSCCRACRYLKVNSKIIKKVV